MVKYIVRVPEFLIPQQPAVFGSKVSLAKVPSLTAGRVAVLHLGHPRHTPVGTDPSLDITDQSEQNYFSHSYFINHSIIQTFLGHFDRLFLNIQLRSH